MTHYGTLSGALAYHAAHGNTAWSSVTATDEQRTIALTRASATLDGQYGLRFPGRKTGGRAQALAWPRTGASDRCAGEDVAADEVPLEIESAAYEIALAELTGQGKTAPTVTPGRMTKVEHVDVIEREFFGPADGVPVSADAMRPVLTTVEDLLRCLLLPASGGTVFLERA